MSDIVKQEPISFPAHFNEIDRQKFVIQEISKAYVYVGQTPTKADLSIMAAAVSRMIERDYPFMNSIDIQEAIEKGSLGRYGDYFGINLKTIDEWLRTHTRMKKEVAATARRLKEVEEERKNQEPTVSRVMSIVKLMSKNPDKVPSYQKLVNKHQTKR